MQPLHLHGTSAAALLVGRRWTLPLFPFFPLVQPPQQPHVRELPSEPQRALLGSLGAGREAVQASLRELEVPQARPQLGSDPSSLQWRQSHLDTHRQNVSSQIAAMNAATAQVVTLTAGASLSARPCLHCLLRCVHSFLSGVGLSSPPCVLRGS